MSVVQEVELVLNHTSQWLVNLDCPADFQLKDGLILALSAYHLITTTRMFSFIHSELSQDKTVHSKSTWNINCALIVWKSSFNIWKWLQCVLCCELFAPRLLQQLANTCPSFWGCYSGWTGNVSKWQPCAHRVCSSSSTLIDRLDHFRSRGVKQMLHQLLCRFLSALLKTVVSASAVPFVHFECRVLRKNHVTQFSPCRLNVCSSLFICSFMLATDFK